MPHVAQLPKLSLNRERGQGILMYRDAIDVVLSPLGVS